jgi:uncharacterized protein (TIGR02145 family)
MKHIFTISLCFLALSLSVYGQVPDYVPTEGLVAWYAFNGDADDYAGLNFNGNALDVNYTENRFNQQDQAIELNGYNSLVELYSLNSFIDVDPIMSSYTVSLWFKFEYGQAWQTIFSDYAGLYPSSDPTFSTLVELERYQNVDDEYRLIIQGRHQHSSVGIDLGEVSPNDIWHNLTFSINPDLEMITAFFDGEFFEAPWLASAQFDYETSSENLFIGKRNNWSSDQYFNGSIDEFGIWNRALSAEEIEALYTADITTSGCTDSTANNFNPEATLDDGTCECNNQSIDLYLCHCAGGGYLNEWIRLTTPDGITEEYCDGGCSAGNWSPVNHAPELQCQNMANTIQASSNYFNAQCIENNTVRFVLRENSLGLSTIETSYCGECGIWSINDEVNPQGEYSFSCYYDPGCMDSNACNYNPDATDDDGSCDFSCCPGPGCCGEGTVWDADAQECIVENPTDTNFDGCTDLNDLLDILSAYGDCAVAEFNCGDPLQYQGYDYETVQIGDQCWFSENCRYLPVVSPSSEGSDTDPYYYVYDYQGTDIEEAKATENYETYGVLYNWPAVMTEGLCPSGWHVPTDGEVTELADFLGGESVAGYAMKSTSGWNSGGNGSNSSGFTALPGGVCGLGSFSGSGGYCYWWSSTESISDTSWLSGLDYSLIYVYRAVDQNNRGFSARCIKD